MLDASKLVALATAMQDYINALVVAIGRKLAFAHNANNALKIGTKNQTNLNDDVQALLIPHLSASNPHEVTLEDIDAYSSEVILGKLGDKVLQGILPISKFRVSTGILITNEGGVWTMTVTDLLLVISGRFIKLPKETVIEISPLTTGATYYLYGILSAGFVNLMISGAPLNESDGVFYITRFIKDVNTSQTIAHGVVGGVAGIVRLDTARVSTAAAGSSIPVSVNNTTLQWK